MITYVFLLNGEVIDIFCAYSSALRKARRFRGFFELSISELPLRRGRAVLQALKPCLDSINHAQGPHFKT